MSETLALTNMTTQQLVDTYLDTHIDFQMEEDDAKRGMIADNLDLVQKALLVKVDNIEHVMLRKKIRKELLKKQIEIYSDTVKSLRDKLKLEDDANDQLEDLVIHAVENTGEETVNGTTLEANGFKYTVYHSPGPLEITDLDSVPNEFTRMKVDIDKSRLRKHVLENQGDVEYAHIPRVKRLKVT